MAKTVDTFSTIEDFRVKYNELATDVGDKSGLRTQKTGTIIDAVNSIEDKSFFFQEFIYDVTSTQTVFNGNDAFQNSLLFRRDRIQVFHIDGGVSKHLLEGNDYSIATPDGNLHKEIQLNVAAQSGDKLVVYSFTGSYLGTVSSGTGAVGYFSETAANTIYNNNDSGIILNGTSVGRTTSLESGYEIQLAGETYVEDNVTLATSKTLTAPTLTTGTASLQGSTGTGFTNITSTLFSGNVTGTTATLSGTVSGGTVTGTTVTDGTASMASGALSGVTTIGATGNITTTGKILYSNMYSAEGDLPSASTYHGMFAHVHGTGKGYFAHNGAWKKLLDESSSDTDDLAEGTNKYFTNTRARDAISAGGDLTYNSTTGVISFTQTEGDITAISTNSGSGLAGGVTQGAASLSVNTSNGVTITGNNVQLDYETVNSAPSSVGSTSTGHLWFVI